MSHLITRTALMAAAATLLTACASTAQYPIVEGAAPGTGPQMDRRTPAYPVQTPAAVENMSAPQARPTEEVERGTLTAAAPPAPVESSPLAAPAAAQEDEPETAPPPALRPAYSPPPPPPQPITKTV